MYEIKEINELIHLILDLTNEEFNSRIDDCPAYYYYLNGGCYELAQIVKHYFPSVQYALRKDLNHCAIYYDDKLFDAYDGLDDFDIKRLNIPEEEKNKDMKDFDIVEKEEIDKLIIPLTKNITDYYGNSMDVALIKEIDSIDSIKISGK